MKKSRNSGQRGGDEPGLWQRVTRSIKAYGSPPKEPSVVKKAAVKPKTTPVTSPRPPARELDGSTSAKLKRGQLSLEGRLDLHGMTQAEAFNALHRFLQRAAADGKRTVLVITGKGLRSEGVLRRMVPLWLEDNKNIIALTSASPKDGGDKNTAGEHAVFVQFCGHGEPVVKDDKPFFMPLSATESNDVV